MERCPICGAASAEKETCHRCGQDLIIFETMEQQSMGFLTRATQALKTHDYNRACRLAKRSCSIKYTTEAARLLFHAGFLANNNSIKPGWRCCVSYKKPIDIL